MSSTNSQQTSSLATNVFKSREILLELLETQGYNISEYTGFDFNQVNSMINNNQLDMLLQRKSTETTTTPIILKTYVKYHLNKQLNQTSLQETITDLFDVEKVLEKKDNLVVIIKEDKVNETMINLLKQAWEQYGVYIAIYPLQRLQFNVTKHRAVHPHSKLPPKKFGLMKYRFNVSDNNELPTISRFDPVAMAIGLRPDEACEIIRPNKSAIHSVYYRICVNR